MKIGLEQRCGGNFLAIFTGTVLGEKLNLMEDRRALRGYVTDEVKRTNGQIRFEDAQDIQRMLPDFD